MPVPDGVNAGLCVRDFLSIHDGVDMSTHSSSVEMPK